MNKAPVNKMLLVDDDEVSNFVLTELIGEMGITSEIVSCKNGADAMTYLQRNITGEMQFPDIILLDVNMPVMGGLEFLERFQQLPKLPKKPVIAIMLTTALSGADAERAQNLGSLVSSFVEKPLTKESIQKIIDIHQKKLTDGNEP